MECKTLEATIKGNSCSGKAFVAKVLFTLIPPKSDEAHYGTGYYMSVEETSDIFPKRKDYVDVRYERTTDIEVLANRYIDNYYGENAKEVSYMAY